MIEGTWFEVRDGDHPDRGNESFRPYGLRGREYLGSDIVTEGPGFLVHYEGESAAVVRVGGASYLMDVSTRLRFHEGRLNVLDSNPALSDSLIGPPWS